MGGASFEDEFGRAAVERGLAVAPQIVAALESLVSLGYLSATGLTRYAGESGARVISLDASEAQEMRSLGTVARGVLSRRGIAAVEEALESLRSVGVTASDVEIRSLLSRLPGLETIGGGAFYWRPGDADSAFVHPMARVLSRLGPLPTRALWRIHRRARRSDRYGAAVDLAVFTEALSHCPFLRHDGERWSWTGPSGGLDLGIAEGPICNFLESRHPTTTAAEILVRCPQLNSVTVYATLNRSPFFDRVVKGVFALPGAKTIPDDVEDARRRAGDIAAAVREVDAGWDDGEYVVRVDLYEPAPWGVVLRLRGEAPSRLAGDWDLRESGETWLVTVGPQSAWGGFGAWLSRQDVAYPARLTTRFDLATRTVHPSVEALPSQ